MKPICLSIAGFDGSGGAGIQADLKTFSALGCYGMTVLTALPIQNTCGVRKIYDIPLSAIEEQLEAIFEDIVPHSIKIGMLFSAPIIELIADFLQKYAKNIPIVLDPVMVAKSGNNLLLPEAIVILKNKLIPLSTMLTPNIPEALQLVGPADSREALGRRLLQLGSQAVLLKGGHDKGQECNDLFLDQNNQMKWLQGARIDTKNTHGTGCTLSAAICAGLALNKPLIEACAFAKAYLFHAIQASKNNSVGKGQGPVCHHSWDGFFDYLKND